MEMAELRALLTREGLTLLDGLGPITTSADVAREVSRLRAAGHSPDLVSAVVGQARLRTKAAAKFGPFAARMLFTPAGLEQATRRSVAAHHAGRMRAAGIEHVADLGCGIGGDALAFAAVGMRVSAVEADEVTAAIAAYNLAVFGEQVEVHHGAAQDHVAGTLRSDSPAARGETGAAHRSLSERSESKRSNSPDAIWLDPARRTTGHGETRRVGVADYSPPLDWALDLAERIPTGIKLSPAHDRDALPPGSEAQWVSAEGETVELVLWSGALARPGVRRSALLLRGDEAHELTAPGDTEDAPARALGAYLHEPDGAVIRARLIGEVARSLDAGPLDPRIAYLTSDAGRTSPFVQTFRVREAMPAKVPVINAALRDHGIGVLEIKKRGMDVDPAQFRQKLVLRGDDSATLLLTRIGDKRLAILADRP